MSMTETQERDQFEHARENAKGWLASIEDMLGDLGAAQLVLDEGQIRGERQEELARQSLEAARQAIEESVLSVQVRTGWYAPGHSADRADEQPEEYEILLTTGGPALRIYGRLDRHCQPESAELQMQDWGTPWTRYPAPEATLLAFASVFWFGE